MGADSRFVAPRDKSRRPLDFAWLDPVEWEIETQFEWDRHHRGLANLGKQMTFVAMTSFADLVGKTLPFRVQL